MKRINFGAGTVQKEGWYHIDIDSSFNVDSSDSSPVESNTIDYIVAHHSLQCISWEELPDILKDLHRVLKVGGILRVSIPDIMAAFQAYKENNLKWFPEMDGSDIDTRFSKYLSWYSTNITPMTTLTLQNLFKQCGFENASLVHPRMTFCKDDTIRSLDSRFNESIYIEAIK